MDNEHWTTNGRKHYFDLDGGRFIRRLNLSERGLGTWQKGYLRVRDIS